MAEMINALNYGGSTYPFSLPYAVCDTAAATAAKTVTVDNFSLEEGAMVVVKFTNANSAASPTLNVNSTGAKSIMRYGTTAASTTSSTSGWVAGAVTLFVYDGTNWVRDYWSNSTYSNYTLGQGYGTCSTAAATTAKVVSLSNYALVAGGIVTVKFTYAVPASATMNVNSKGAKNIYWRGATITAGVIGAGDFATFMYDGTQYHVISVDRELDVTHPSLTASSVGSAQSPSHGGTFAIPKITYDANGHITAASTVNITLPADNNTDTKNTAGSTNSSSKLFLIGATSQAANPQTYSHDTAYVGTDGHLYSNSVQVVNLSGSQALTNKTYNGYTLGAACAKGVDTTATSGSSNLITSGAMYTALAGKAASSHTHDYLPLSGGTLTGNLKLGANTLTIGGATVSYNSSSDIFDVSAASGNSATVSVKLGSKTVGSATQPIYFNAGTPTACTYTLGKSVPSDAKFTDTTYTSLKNPYSLTIQGNGTTLTNGTYDGSAAKTVNITPASIGAAASSHTHSYLPLSGGTLTGGLTGTTITTSDVIQAGSNIIVPNATSYSAYDLNDNRITLLYLSSTDNIHIGSEDETSDTCHTGNTYVSARNGRIYLSNKNRTLAWYSYDDSDDYDSILRCQTDAKATCGSTSYRWYKLYAATTTIGTSDEREKSDIMSIEDYPVTYSADNEGNVFEQLFDKLTPKTYALNVESTGEIRIGFIAQDIVKSLEELGLSEGDLGIIDHEYWTDEETGEEKDRYGLAYTEFIALNTYMIQKQKAKIKEQQTQIESLEERIVKLEQLISA